MSNSMTNGVSAVFDEIYDSNSNTNNTSSTPYDKFDIIYIAFAHIDHQTKKLDFEDVKDGGKEAEKERLRNIQGLTKELRENNQIKLCISLGYGQPFNDIPLIMENLDTFAPSVAEFLSDNHLDGFDVDYESPVFSSNEEFKTFSEAIRNAIGPDLNFSITPNNTTYLDGYTLNEYYNYVNVQCYDAPGDLNCPITNFTNMEGLDLSKIVAGADLSRGEDIQNAINKYNKYQVGGVFAWELAPDFGDIADAMWNATHPNG